MQVMIVVPESSTGDTPSGCMRVGIYKLEYLRVSPTCANEHRKKTRPQKVGTSKE